ncbi:MAG: HAD family hydrolase [Synechococcus sp.]
MKAKIEAIIFDLDNCLASAREVGEELFQPVFDAIRKANDGNVSDDVLTRAFEAVWRHPFDWVSRNYGFSEAMFNEGWRVFMTLEASLPMQGYLDLPVLETLAVKRFLVTSGFLKLQKTKITALSLEAKFDGVYIDAIDAPDRVGKRGLFKKILDDNDLLMSQVIVIGDNADSEIKTGNELGIKTVQILREGVPYAENADFHIHSLDELKILLEG